MAKMLDVVRSVILAFCTWTGMRSVTTGMFLKTFVKQPGLHTNALGRCLQEYSVVDVRKLPYSLAPSHIVGDLCLANRA